jgi:hypothetical protein
MPDSRRNASSQRTGLPDAVAFIRGTLEVHSFVITPLINPLYSLITTIRLVTLLQVLFEHFDV